MQLSRCSIRLALGHIVYCEYIPPLTKSHLNSKSAMDFFFNLKLYYVYWLKMPGDYWYILVVIETTQYCLDLAVGLRKRPLLLFKFTRLHKEIQLPLKWYIACCSEVNSHISTDCKVATRV